MPNTLHPDVLRKAILEVVNTSFQCGEWSGDDSDETYSEVYARSQAAETHLFAVLGIGAPAFAVPASSADLVRQARAHLRTARELLKTAGAKRTLERVRAAIRSADGAQRHADLEPYRTARQAVEG